MDLIIYETTHFENIPALLELSKRFFTNTTIFLTEHSYQQILPIIKKDYPTGISFKIQTKEISNRAFIKLFFKYISLHSVSHLHINTLQNNLLPFGLRLLRLKNIKVSMTVHSINEYKTFSFNNLKEASESLAKLILHKKIDSYHVLAPAMEPYFKKCFPHKKVVFIPGNFFEPDTCQNISKKNEYFTIVIPGTIEARRRDYHFVIHFLTNNILKLNQYTKIKLALVGNADSVYGQLIIEQLKKITTPNFSLQWFDKEVDQQTYNKLLCEADIIWSPIRVLTKGMHNVPEMSGTSISPGFITDQIHFGRPAIIPQKIQVHEALKNCNFIYENEQELLAIFIEILSNDTILIQKRTQTLAVCKYFNADNYLPLFKKLINETS